jgi:parallel beta-helix repeat protein
MFLLLLLPLVSPLLSSISKENEVSLFNDAQDDTSIPKSSNFWVLEPLHIEDTGVGGNYTWAEAVLQDWCSGAGTLNEPYLLENITIDAGGDPYAILIENSNNKYFTIRNCTLTNAGSLIYNAGIQLISTSNGTIEDSTLLNNSRNGIIIRINSNYNTIQNNIVMDGDPIRSSGIGTDIGCDFNTFINNTVHNHIYGIDIWSNNINITGNHVTNSIESARDGIYVRDGRHNFVSNNVVNTHPDCNGIFLDFCNETTVINNHLFNNQIGIYNRGENNYIASNLLENNYGGLAPQQSFNSIFFNNTLIGNEKGILVNSPTNTFYMNYLYNNLLSVYEATSLSNNWSYNGIGNYWSDYSGADLNDDGIGDTPYLIDGPANSQDDYPIWDDGENVLPTISINSPTGGALFGADAPTYNLDVFDLNLNQSWYTLNNSAAKYFFTPTNGINVVVIDETGWDSFSEGSMSMTFYVNDSNANFASVSNVILKDPTSPVITLNSPIGGTKFGSDAPEFNLTIYDSHLHDAWYTIGSSITPHPFSPINGINVVAIDEISWDALPEGDVTISFFVGDTLGNNRTIQVVINKDLSPDDPDSGPAIPFGHYYIVFLGIGILALLLVQKKKRKI